MAPPQRNVDCQTVTYNVGKSSESQGCVVTTSFGTVDIGGTHQFTFGDSSRPVRLDSSLGIGPVPGQMLVSGIGTAGTVYGQHLYFFTDIYKHLQRVTNASQAEYQIVGSPEVTLRDQSGRMMEFNAGYTLTYSGNGAWAMVDGISGSFYRINLATFDMLPFAPSLEMAPTYSLQRGQTAISEDGRFAAIAYSSGAYPPYFRVYDLSTCKGTLANQVNGAPLLCNFKDYQSYLANQLTGFHGAYNLRFSSDGSLTFYTMYNWKSTVDFDVAQYALSPTSAPFHALDYLAMGDSYISGQGEFLYEAGTDTDNNSCHISPLAYPFIIGGNLFSSYHSVACSGAKTNDVTDISSYYRPQAKGKQSVSDVLNSFIPGYVAQVEFVTKYRPKIITLSIGGNDIGFANIIAACVSPLKFTTCYSTTAERAEIVRSIDELSDTLKTTYTKILQTDPGVQLFVVGYPQIAVEGNCANNVHLNSAEIQFSQQLIAYLDDVIEKSATSVGARYVDTQNALAGNRLCEAKSFNVAVNGLTAGNDGTILGDHVIGAESYHPNIRGHEMLAESILEQTTKLTETMPAPLSSQPSPNDPLAQELTQHLSYDPNTVPLPKSDDSLLPEIVPIGTTQQVTLDGIQNGLQPNASYVAVLHSSPILLGNYTTGADASLNFSVQIPNDVPPGYHVLHIYGQDMSGQSIDIYKQFYVAANTNDYDGDGIPNSLDQCLIMPKSGQDVDKDGIDDACDPFIGQEPMSLPDTPLVASKMSAGELGPAATQIVTASENVNSSSPQNSDSGIVLGETDTVATADQTGVDSVDQILSEQSKAAHKTNHVVQFAVAAIFILSALLAWWILHRAFRGP